MQGAHIGHDMHPVGVQVHVDPVITVNGGVHVDANGTEPMPFLAALLPPTPTSSPPPPTDPGGTGFLDSDARDNSVTALPPVTPAENAAFNAGTAFPGWQESHWLILLSSCFRLLRGSTGGQERC